MELLAEWLETDGRMGFASGTISGRRTRRYHGLLLVRTPAGRFALVNGVEVWLETPDGTFGLSTQEFPDNVIHPNGEQYITDFQLVPWPTWRFETPGGGVVTQEWFTPKGQSCIVLRWRWESENGPAQLHVKPLLSGRDYHVLHHKNEAFHFDFQEEDNCIRWQPYADRPAILARANARYEHAPRWMENFYHSVEAERGMDTTEDLAVPGEFHFENFSDEEAVLIFAADGDNTRDQFRSATSAKAFASEWDTKEQARRKALGDSLRQAADTYLVQRGDEETIIAGYPWFTDWGRDTFIALRGLCLATGRLDVAEEILCSWAGTVSEGMLPNRFPDQGETPEFNSVDASLWYVIAVGEFVQQCERQSHVLSSQTKTRLRDAISQILTGYRDGTRYNIRMQDDGLISAGEPGVQLTWMDAKVDGWVVTPRMGKPVEIQALWINALSIGYDLLPEGEKLFERAFQSFQDRFWNPEQNCLYDVVDADHQPGAVDAAIRPNQLFAAGGLPLSLLGRDRARQVVDVVEQHLYTPLGLRSLAPEHPDYKGTYIGSLWDRDGAYHQGTVWCWLIGPFVEAWVRVRGNTPEVQQEAREKFLTPLADHLKVAGLGHISEIADGDPPHTPRGCPFQAWSLGEYLRLDCKVLKSS